MSVANKLSSILIILFVHAICLPDVPTSVQPDPQTLQEEAAIMKTPAKYSQREYAIRADKRSREGFKGDVVRIPFHIENTLNLSHPGIFTKGGIPLPKGIVKGVCSFYVLDKNDLLPPARIKKSAYWPDGSIKWVLVVMPAPQTENSREQYTLKI